MSLPVDLPGRVPSPQAAQRPQAAQPGRGTAGLFLGVLWSLRLPALFFVGPVAGVLLVAAVFGLPRHLLLAAGVMALLGLALFGVLARGEWHRLRRR